MNLNFENANFTAVNGTRIYFDRYCPTWTNPQLFGWRKFLNRWFRIPKRLFQHEKPARVYYKVGADIICSFENYDRLVKGLDSIDSIK
jgi:hypothetical protein